MAFVRMRRVLLLLVNVVATSLTLFTGLRETAIFQLIVGRNGMLRSRLKQGRINYDIARLDEMPLSVLPDLTEVADTYKFHRAPTRSPSSTGEDRSTCMRVNSMNASVLNVHFDDAFGQNVRREQLFLFSISAPHCDVINLKPKWVKQQCVDGLFKGNATACSEYILTHFDRLKADRSLQVGVPVDFGVVGAPYLKCQGRTDQSFVYITDLLVMQSFWGGGSFQVEFQSSKCWARPALGSNESVGLFRVEAFDKEAAIAVAVPLAHEFVSTVSSIYGLFYLGFVAHGLRMIATAKRSFVWYFTSATKKAFVGYLGYLPFTDLVGRLVPVRNRVHIFRFHGKPVVAANLWMNHWLFISLSILDACLNVRSVYMMLTMGTWLLDKKVTFENFLFVCTPLTKITWITCLGHTIFQRAVQIGISIAESPFRGFPHFSRFLGFLRWYVDAVALLTTFKIYSIALVLQLYVVFKVKGIPTVSTRAANAKRPVYGGFADLETLWKSEIVIDLACMVLLQIAFAHVLLSLLLLTRFRRTTHNRFLKILQRRYVFVGWDAFVAMDALGIDPFREPVRDENGQLVAPTYCTAGALLRQLGSSGPSGWVRLAGEEALLDMQACRTDTDAKSHEERRILSSKRLYPHSVAREMGIDPQPSKNDAKASCIQASGAIAGSSSSQVCAVRPIPKEGFADLSDATGSRVPFQLRALHAHTEGTWGSLLLVDFLTKPATAAGAAADTQDHRRSSVGIEEDSVITVYDALGMMDDKEQRALLVGGLKLRIC